MRSNVTENIYIIASQVSRPRKLQTDKNIESPKYGGAIDCGYLFNIHLIFISRNLFILILRAFHSEPNCGMFVSF